jgi:hypothetical protein
LDELDEENEPDDLVIIDIEIPNNFGFTIDPVNVAGRGQVYSDEITIYNNGETDILFSFTDIDLKYSGDIILSPDAYGITASFLETRKIIWLAMKFNCEQIEQVTLTGLDYLQLLEEPFIITSGDSLSFEIIGKISQSPSIRWNNGDVKIQFVYQIEAIIPFCELDEDEELLEDEDLLDDDEDLEYEDLENRDLMDEVLEDELLNDEIIEDNELLENEEESDEYEQEDEPAESSAE